ncbi:SRPBCC family protein [Marmoricola endophyticus]|nr:SRPBCC family protein [Marmoricola endophyticus]
MSHLIQRTVHTSWDAQSVFDYLLAFENAVEWDAGTVTCHRTSGEGGVGTTYENVSEFRGSRTTLEYTVESVEGSHRFVIIGRNKTVTSKDTITVEEHDGSTSVDYQAEMTFHGIAKLASPFLGGALTKLGDDAEKTLSEALSKHAGS